MFDIFYIGKKPNLFAHEQAVDSVEQAQRLTRTRFFWLVHYLAGLDTWDFLWEPAPWQAHQRHAWPNQHQPDSGVYLIPRDWDGSDTNYHIDPVIHHKADLEYWHIPDWIDANSIDPAWSPDPADPPYIYEFPVEWGWDRVGGPQYRVPGATDIKYVTDFVARTQHNALAWYQHCDVRWSDELSRWRPDPTDPPYNYVFGNQWYSAEVMPTVEYRMPDAWGNKYMDLRAQLPERHSNCWHTLYDCDWDYSWVPDPGDPPYIYVWGNQWWPAEVMATVEYHVPGATERKYMSWPAKLVADRSNWQVPDCIDVNSVDFSWRPDPGSPAYIYEFATQWQPNGGARYVVPGATEVKYVDIQHRRIMCKEHWHVPHNIDANSIDFSWHPDTTEPPYIYEFATQWQPNGGARYVVPGATEHKYVDISHAALPCHQHWQVPTNVDANSIDFSWHPSNTAQSYIYEFATQWQPNGGARYVVPGATEISYVDIQHRRLADSTHWQVPTNVDANSIDFSWHPNATEEPYIYEFATEWQPNGGARYVVPGAVNIKYVDIQHQRQRDLTHWQVPHTVDADSVDYSWHPDATDEPYIYEFATEWQPNGGARYVVPGAVNVKYVDIQHRRLADAAAWHIPSDIDPDSVDLSWHPNATDEPYIYEFATQWQPNGGARYVVPGATEVKYVSTQHRKLPNAANWSVPAVVDASSVDLSWHPDATEPPYIYEFATQWQPNGGAVYTVPGATERKYVDIQHRRLPDKTPWKLLQAVAKFDYSWHPDATEQPYNYVFGNQHWPGTEMPTLMYCVSGATQEKFVDNVAAELWQCMEGWELCEDIDHSAWDWSWVPNPQEPPYIYVWGNQWHSAELRPSVKYAVPGATERKYMPQRTRRLPQPDRFETKLAVTDFDWSWEPDPTDPPMTYVFGNQWNDAVLEPTVLFNNGGADIKYVDTLRATVAADSTNWTVLDDIEQFDFSWRPNPTDPPYIYVFGNQWHTPEQRPTVQYHVPGATDIKYMHHPRAQRRQDPGRFQQLYPCEFDWSWEPDPGSPPYDYVFGNQYHAAEVMPTVIYHVPGATERKYMDLTARLLPAPGPAWRRLHECEWDYTWRPEPGSPPYIYVWGNQWHAAEVMPTVEYHMPGATERKYMTAPVAQLPVCLDHWYIPPRVDTTDMDFSWVPDPGEPPYIYQFATQHQKTGGPQYRMPGATEFKYVDWMRAEVSREAAPIFEIDHLDGNAGQIPNTVKKVRYFDNYRDTLIRLARSLEGEYEHVWVCSSICDYEGFDFSWHPETWQSTMLHVFASNDQKFGDTFYMHVPTFAQRAEKKQLLEWYSVNYVPRRSVPRRSMPVIAHTADSHVDAVKNTDWPGPLALFTTNGVPITLPSVPLWRQEVKTIVPLSAGASAVIVPKSAQGDIKSQLYDYDHIDKSQRKRHSDDPLDIVFIENGEPNAKANFLQLQLYLANNSRFTNQVHVVSGVNGRVAAYHAAARASTTPWFFAVFAKLEVSADFDWLWQPDRMQQAKHYIFHARNPVNGLEYGHQAMIAYNRDLVLANPGQGLDFTLDSPHEVVPILSGDADYAHTPWMAWRTAFREVLKLQASLPDVENEYRLNRWLDVDNTPGQWSQKGAQDAVEYFEEVGGDFAALRQSYDWAWLASYALLKRGLAPDP